MGIFAKIRMNYGRDDFYALCAMKLRSYARTAIGLRPNAPEMVNKGVKVSTLAVFSKKATRKILVIKLDHMGDFLLAIPALVRLREKFKDAEIDVVVGEWNVPVAKSLGIFSRIHIYNFFGSLSVLPPESKGRVESELLMGLGRYDIALDLRRQRDTRFFLSKVNAAVKAGFKTFSDYDATLSICLPTEIDEPGVRKTPNNEHISMQMLRLVDALSAGFVDLPELVRPQKDERRVALFPGAGNAVKEWAAVNYAALCKGIITTGLAAEVSVYVKDAPLARPFSGIKGVTVLSAMGFDELVSSVAGCSLAVANNSFGAHLASYLGVPVVAVYGGHETVDEWRPPFGETTVVYSDVSCSPCHIPDVSSCPYDMVCLKQIMPEDVLTAAKEILETA